MKRTILLIAAFASASVFAAPSATEDSVQTIQTGATLKQSGDNCQVALKYLEAERAIGVAQPSVKGIEVNKKCSQLVSAGLIANEKDKLVFTARARSMTPSELSAALTHLPD